MFGIGIVAAVHYRYIAHKDLVFVIGKIFVISKVTGSFGASSVLIYGAPSSPMAQPRNFIGGHLVSALVGVTCKVALFDYTPEVAAAAAV